MTWAQAVDAIAEEVSVLDVVHLEELARRVPLMVKDQHHAAVGAGIERVLQERYRTGWELWTDAAVFAAGHRHPGDTYRDRVDRARSDAAYRILEERHPGEPFDTFPYADNVQEAPEGAWRDHVRTFYGIK